MNLEGMLMAEKKRLEMFLFKIKVVGFYSLLHCTLPGPPFRKGRVVQASLNRVGPITGFKSGFVLQLWDSVIYSHQGRKPQRVHEGNKFVILKK
jgi:hypothetical protein